MSGIELNRPVRFRVDLSTPLEMPRSLEKEGYWHDPVRAERGISAVVESGIFFLELGYPVAEDAVEKVLLDFTKRASSRGILVSVIVRSDDVSLCALHEAGAREAALDLTGVEGGESAMKKKLAAFMKPGRKDSRTALKTGAHFLLCHDTVSSLRDVLNACNGIKVDFLDLPPPPLIYYPAHEAAGVLIETEEYQHIREVLRKSACSLEGIGDLRVHDILISAMLDNLYDVSGSGRTLFSGCQAATALCHIGPDGLVYPCASLGIPLGSVEDLNGMDFWGQTRVSEIRERVSRLTPECDRCRAVDICHGGCPGIRVAACGSWDGDDPLCPLFKDLADELR